MERFRLGFPTSHDSGPAFARLAVDHGHVLLMLLEGWKDGEGELMSANGRDSFQLFV